MKKRITDYSSKINIFKMMFLIFIECIAPPFKSSYIYIAKGKSCIIFRTKCKDVTITNKEDGTVVLESVRKC